MSRSRTRYQPSVERMEARKVPSSSLLNQSFVLQVEFTPIVFDPGGHIRPSLQPLHPLPPPREGG
jgi:hypothetical protein